MTAPAITRHTLSETRQQASSKHEHVPIVEALRANRAARIVPFTTPGHKQGQGADPDLVNLLGAEFFANDIWLNTTQFAATLREAEDLAADAWGAERTHFLVNGSSSGNVAALLALVRPGDTVIVSRDMHRSMLAALMLSGAQPVYVEPRLDPEHGISLGVSPASVEAALVAHPDARLVALVSPSYYGISVDLREIVRVAHARDVPVFVDEAWGPHFAFHPALPDSAIQAGADIAVTSAHKLLGALSQGSMLHLQGTRVDRQRLATTVAMTQTTSPLLPILASLDTSRRQMALDGTALLDRTIALAEQARCWLNGLPGISVVDARMNREIRTDPTRLVIDVSGIGLTGYTAEQLLRSQGIAPEMSDLHSIVCLISIGDRRESIVRLIAAVAGLIPTGQQFDSQPRSTGRALGQVITPAHPVLSPAEAFHRPTRTVPLVEAAGEVCAEMIVPYPPGIPVLLPGERITRDRIDYLRTVADCGISVSGASDPTLATIRVVASSLLPS
jgi:arginine/lysine/ornithine decarboxylase